MKKKFDELHRKVADATESKDFNRNDEAIVFIHIAVSKKMNRAAIGGDGGNIAFAIADTMAKDKNFANAVKKSVAMYDNHRANVN